MIQFERVIDRVAESLVDFSRRRRAITIVSSLLLASLSVYWMVTRLEIDTDSDRLLAASLPVRQTNIALAEAFPVLQNNLVIMIEADDTGDARDAALELRERLAAAPDRYPEVFLPGYGQYFDDFGLYYLDDEDLDELAARIDQAGPLLATLASRSELPILLAAFSHIIESDDGLDSLGHDGTRILDQLTRTIDGFNRGESVPIDWDDLLFENVGDGLTNPQLLLVKPVGDLTQMQPVLTALRDIRGMIPELTPRPGLRVRVTGDRATHTEEMSLIINEVGLAVLSSLAMVTLVLAYALRSFRLVVVTMATLLVGLAWTAGFAAIAVGRLNALTSAFAVLYIGLGVDYGIHFALDYLDHLDHGDSVEDAFRKTGASVGSSLFLCAFTTALGFYAFLPTEYSAVADIGVIGGSGIFLGLLATLTFFPAMLASGENASSSRSSSALQRRISLLPRFPVLYPRTVCGVTAVLTLVGAIVSTRVHFDFSTLKVRDPRVESVQALADLLDDPDLSVWTIDVLAADTREAAAVAEQLEALDGIEQVRTAAGFVPENQEEKLQIFQTMREDLVSPVDLTEEERGEGLDRIQAVEYTIEGYGVALDIDADLRGDAVADSAVLPAAERLRAVLAVLLEKLRNDEFTPAELDVLEADVFGNLPDVVGDIVDALPQRTVTIDDLPADLLSRYVAADGRARVEIFSEEDLDDRGNLEHFADLVHAVRPDAGGPAAGTVALGRAIVSSFSQALLTAVIMIAVVLLVLSRSIKYTLIILAPLVVGSVATGAVSVAADIPLNFANVIVLPLLLGTGVDSGIHLVHRHRSGLRDPKELLTTPTARAVWFSALTTIVSFVTLAFSNHRGIASLAQMLCVGIVLMLASNVIVLPAILTWVDGRDD